MMKRIVALGLTLVMGCLCCGCTANNQAYYEQAQLYLGIGEYDEAIRRFEQLGEYRDAAEYALYCEGIEALQAGETALARANFLQVTPFKSSERYLAYLDAMALWEAERLEEAQEAFTNLGSFLDSTDVVAEIAAEIPERQLNRARALMEQKHYEQAKNLLAALGGYGDSVTLMDECERGIQLAAYERAKAMFDASDYEGAMAAFEAMGDTLDAKARVLLCRSAMYQQAEAAYATVTVSTVQEVMAQYQALEDYLGSAARISELKARYDITLRLMESELPYMRFGAYAAGESGAAQPVDWQVLAVEDGVAVLLSTKVLDAGRADMGSTLPLTLTELEHNGLVSQELPSLSLLTCLPQNAWRCMATPYAKAQGVRHHSDGGAWWWLADERADGRQRIVWYDGSVPDIGVAREETVVGIRPVVRVSLDKFTLTAGTGTVEDPFR